MRVTDTNIFSLASYRINRGKNKLDSLTEMISSGMKANSLGDDPLAVQSIVRNDERSGRLDQFSTNATNARNQLNTYESVLTEVYNLLTTLKSDAVALSNETTSYEQLDGFEEKLNLAKEQLIALANTQNNDSYIFSGYKTDTEAYDENGTYQGDTGNVQVEIMNGVKIDLNINGTEVFGGGTSGVTDLFTVIDQMKSSLHGDFPKDFTENFDDLDAVADNITRATSQVGSRMVYTDIAASAIERLKVSNAEVSQSVEEIDYADTLVQYKAQEIALQATLQTNSTLMMPSLMDYITR